jgi:tetratricopeptide (TPR) repeat protein
MAVARHTTQRQLFVWLLAGLIVLLCFLLLAGCNRKESTPEPKSPLISADEQFELGNTAYQQGDLQGAAAAFEAALQVDPHHLGSLTNLGVVYYQLGRLDDAATKFEAGLDAERRDAQLHYLLGAVRLQQSRLTDAEASFLKARELDPTLPEVYYGLGALYKLQGKTDEAIAAFERFLEIGPGQDPRAEQEAERELRELRNS